MRTEKQLVLQLIKKYKTSDPFQICDHLNIQVSFANLGSINGFYRYLKRNKFILINDNLSYERKRFVCSHELGHHLLHKDSNRLLMDSRLYIPNRYENDANRFAIYLTLESLDTWELEQFSGSEMSEITGIPEKYLYELNL